MSRNNRIRDALVALPITRDVVARFVPGSTFDEALPALRALTQMGAMASIDVLGEDITDAEQARETANSYETVLGRLRDEGLTDSVEVSLKLSAVGQALGRDGQQLATDNARLVCQAAADAGTTVTLDMEDHTTTDSTLAILHDVRQDFPTTGAVLQAYLRRTLADCRDLAHAGSRVRLCKGAYEEPASVAYKERKDVDASYVECLGALFDGGAYPMVASHDPAMISAAQQIAEAHEYSADAYEFQMLYGIRPLEQRRLLDTGHQMRVYFPYGTDWYGYFTRRLAERPANMLFFARSLIGRR